MKIPHSEEIAKLYSQGIPLVQKHSSWKIKFERLFELRHNGSPERNVNYVLFDLITTINRYPVYGLIDLGPFESYYMAPLQLFRKRSELNKEQRRTESMLEGELQGKLNQRYAIV